MATIATIGPKDSNASQAARKYLPKAKLHFYNDITDVLQAFEQNRADFAVVPIYNTRVGEIKGIKTLDQRQKGYWIDNIIMSLHLSIGTLNAEHKISVITGTAPLIKQCEEYIATHYPNAALMTVKNIEQAGQQIKEHNLLDHAIIESEETLKAIGIPIIQREVAAHNRTRYAVLGPEITVATGYDATAIITTPLDDRVGLLYDILGEFSRRGINIMDMQSESDIKTQKLRFYFEVEGHIDDPAIKQVLTRIEQQIIQEPCAVRVLGSYPRVDMRTRHIKNFGFIGSGSMSKWFADKLTNDGYQTLTSGRSTALRPKEMISQIDALIICVPISATTPTIKQYAPLLKKGQALILLAGEGEDTINTALTTTNESVEVMLVHNLWGPQAASMKDKNVVVVKTSRSGRLCNEFEGFLYKYGANIYHDTPAEHDLLMGVSQKLPTAISISMALALKENQIIPTDIASHSTLTSLYGILAMARLHFQNPRTYAEIMATKGEGRRILSTFSKNLQHIISLADNGEINKICSIIEQSRDYLTEDFLSARMTQSLAVDETLGKILQR